MVKMLDRDDLIAMLGDGVERDTIVLTDTWSSARDLFRALMVHFPLAEQRTNAGPYRARLGGCSTLSVAASAASIRGRSADLVVITTKAMRHLDIRVNPTIAEALLVVNSRGGEVIVANWVDDERVGARS